MAEASPMRASFGRIDIDGVEPEAYREILRAWCAQREGRRFPLKQRIDPFVVPSLAANIILFEVQGETLIYRVLGEKVLTALKADIRGKTPIEALGDTPYIRLIQQQLLECAATGTPLYSRHDFRLDDALPTGTSQSRQAWRIALPYGDEDRVTRLLCYQLFSETIEIHFRQDIDFAKLLPETVFKIEV
jgi:hypothetical protein